MGVELLFNSVEFGSQSSCQRTPRELETRCGGEGHTRPGGPRRPPMQLPADFQTVETRCGREGHT